MEPDTDPYRRFLQGDETGLVQIIETYKDGLILYLNGDRVLSGSDPRAERSAKSVY